MEITYNPEFNYFVECLLVPTILFMENEDDKLVSILKNDLSVYLELKDALSLNEELINKSYLVSDSSYFIIELSGMCQQFPRNMSEFLDEIGRIEESKLLEGFYSFLSAEKTNQTITKELLIDLLETAGLSSKKNWYWTRAIQNPRRFIEELTTLLQWVEKIYDKTYQHFDNERQIYAQQADVLELILQHTPIKIEELNDQAVSQFNLVVLAPFFQFLIFLGDDHGQVVLILGLRQFEDSTSEVIENKQFFDILKLLSDETRYQVLRMTAQNDTKAKDIAQELGITSAAVSYHVSKLGSESLLEYHPNMDSKSLKYSINKVLMKKLVDKLMNDLDLR